MENKIMEAIFFELHNNSIQDFTINIENISNQHSGHFTGNGNTHFIVTISSQILFHKKPLERHRILNKATANLMNEIHAISFNFSNI